MVLEVKQLSKSYLQGDGTSLEVLKNINMDLDQNQTAAIMGESGSGKTTFLNCITGLDKFNSGEIKVCQKDIGALNDEDLSKLRNRNIGFVFQFHYFILTKILINSTFLYSFLYKFLFCSLDVIFQCHFRPHSLILSLCLPHSKKCVNNVTLFKCFVIQFGFHVLSFVLLNISYAYKEKS